MAISMLHKQAPKPMVLGMQPDRERERSHERDRFNRMDHQPPHHFGQEQHDRDRDRRMDPRMEEQMRFERDRSNDRDRRDPRDMRDPREMRDPRDRFNSQDRDPRDRFDRDPRDPRGHRDPRDMRDPRDQRDPRDPRGSGGPRRHMDEGPSNMPPHGIPPQLASSDPDKAALIMQVLQLTDQQIAMLPAEQRASILELKKQIANTPK